MITSRSRVEAVVIAVVLASGSLAGLGTSVPDVWARMTETESVSRTFSTEVLDPPTGVSASAALLFRVNLSWTATIDVRATGYRILRATTSGGPYSQVATIGSRTTTTYQDTVPLTGRYYYVLQSTFAAWTSVSSNEASVLAV